MDCQFSVERSKVKVTGRQIPQDIVAYLADIFTYGRPIKRRRLRQRRLQARPNPLLGLIYCQPETLGNWTDGRISCRHSAPTTSFLVKMLLQYIQTSLLTRGSIALSYAITL